MGKLDDVSRTMGGSRAPGVVTRESWCRAMFSLRCSGVVSWGVDVVSVPVKIERGSHIGRPGCESTDRAKAVDRAHERHAMNKGRCGGAWSLDLACSLTAHGPSR
jgi:hypothetical protein